MDKAVYDVRRQIQAVGPAKAAVYNGVFGQDASGQKESSPITHLAPGKRIPPSLVLHVADRPDSKAQSRLFADKLKEAGVPARVLPAEGKIHGTINADLVLPGLPWRGGRGRVAP